MAGIARSLLRHLAGALLTLLIAGFLGAVLLRYAPGFDVDESAADIRLSDDTARKLAAARSRNQNIFAFYARYLHDAVRGDFGVSQALNVPVTELVSSRAAVTARLIGGGVLLGWTAALGLAFAVVTLRSPPLALLSEALTGIAFSLPAAVFALFLFLWRGPVFIGLALAVFPRVFRYARDLFETAAAAPRLEAARSRGVAPLPLFWRYVFLSVAGPLAALAGVSFSVAFGALIPVEVVCDVPGIGHLALDAALARDLPVLVCLTLLVTAATLAANGFAEWWTGPRTT